jgi:AmiR/NasT family two-component response regulator
MDDVASRASSPWERVTRLAQAQGRVSVQANCTMAEALVLMQQRADATRHTLDEIAEAVGQHRIWFSQG